MRDRAHGTTFLKKRGSFKAGIGLVGLLLASLILAACGEDATATPTPKDLPRDRVLYLSNRDGWPDLYTIDQGGKISQRLTETAAAEYGAVWSPDGRKVAFTELEGDQANGDYARVRRIVTIDGDGKNRKLITTDGFNPVWSPDSSRVLFVRAIANSPTATSRPDSERYSANIMAAPEAQATVSRSPAAPTTTPSAGRSPTPAASPRTTPSTAQVTTTRGSTTPGNATPANLSPAPAGPTATPAPLVAASTPNGGVPPTAQTDATPASGAGSNSRFKGGLYTAPADGSAGVRGGTPVTLIADNAVEGEWSPDGTKIAYIAGNNDLNQKRSLFLMSPDGSNKVSLSQRAKLDNLDILHVVWSPDGTSLAITAADPVRDRVSLFRLPLEAASARRLTDYNGSARDLTGLVWAYDDYFNPATRLHISPVWSPNGRRLAFTDGSSTITVVEADSGNQLTFPIGAAALGQDKDSVLNVTWLPDNRRLLYDRAEAGRNALLAQANFYIFDYFDETLETLDTVNKNTTKIAGPGASFFTPLCCGVDLLSGPTPDSAAPGPTPQPKPTTTTKPINGSVPSGKLVYTSGVGQRQLIVNDLKTGERTVISSGLFKLLDFSLSPRNDRLVYMEVGDKYNATLYLSSLDGKQKRKLSEGIGEPDDLSSVVAWSPDGRQVAFQVLKGDPNLKPGLYTLNVDAPDSAAAAPRLLTDKLVSGFSWSPDNRQIAFKVDASFYELWTVSVDGGPGSARQLKQLGLVNPNYASLGKGVAWSPNGKWIATTGPTQYSRFSLWLFTVASGELLEIPSSVIARIAGWTPDSSRLLTIVATFSQNTELQALNTNSTTWRQYDAGSGPQISSDGLFVAYYSRRDLRASSGAFSPTNPTDLPSRLLILQLSNGEVHPVSLDFAPYFSFKARFYNWSPDGRIVTYYYNNSIYGVGPDGQNPQVLARAFTVDKLGWVRG